MLDFVCFWGTSTSVWVWLLENMATGGFMVCFTEIWALVCYLVKRVRMGWIQGHCMQLLGRHP